MKFRSRESSSEKFRGKVLSARQTVKKYYLPCCSKIEKNDNFENTIKILYQHDH